MGSRGILLAALVALLSGILSRALQTLQLPCSPNLQLPFLALRTCISPLHLLLCLFPSCLSSPSPLPPSSNAPTCAPVAEAIRLQACRWGQERDPACNFLDTCALRNCGTNSRCPKDEAGWANCVCLKGFQLLPNASCAHSCAIMVCDPNSSCVKEEDGLAMCVCNWGFAMTPTGCVDTCVLKNRVNSTCSKGAAGNASCACYPDFALHPDGHTCKDTCEIQNCGVNGQCVKDDTGVASCVCDTGFALQEDGKTCIGGCCM
ncbi:unnamed protein product [Closterium sp. NIES-65]|nr:unnamed protein product [Closterium sp. NIES-65]